MDLATASLTVASVLLIVSGPHKVVDPAPLIEFLVGVGVPLRSDQRLGRVRSWLGRSIGVFEIVLGLTAVLLGGTTTAGLVAVTYLVFAALVMLAIGRGVGSCACFGRSDSPPTVLHVVIDLVLAAASFAAIAADTPLAVIDADSFGFGGVMFVIGVGVVVGVIHAVLDGRFPRSQRR